MSKGACGFCHRNSSDLVPAHLTQLVSLGTSLLLLVSKITPPVSKPVKHITYDVVLSAQALQPSARGVALKAKAHLTTLPAKCSVRNQAARRHGLTSLGPTLCSGLPSAWGVHQPIQATGAHLSPSLRLTNLHFICQAQTGQQSGSAPLLSLSGPRVSPAGRTQMLRRGSRDQSRC